MTTDRSTYRRGDTVLVSKTNGSSEMIRGQTGQTYCTIVSVERYVDGPWQMQGRGVAAGGPPGFVPIEAGGEMTVGVFPRLPSDRELVEGRYRIEFIFLVGSTSAPPQTAHSEEFTVIQ